MLSLLHPLLTAAGLSVGAYYVPRMLLIVGTGIVAIVTAPKTKRHTVALEVLRVACRWRGGPGELK